MLANLTSKLCSSAKPCMNLTRFYSSSSTTPSNHKYKLIYFNYRGRAETGRLIFAYAGVDYIDHRLSMEEWKALKPKTPFGNLPLLEIDGGKTVLAQSKAVFRYLAREFNLVPHDKIRAAVADMLVDGLEDAQHRFQRWMFEKDPVKKREYRHMVEKKYLIPFFDRYEKFLLANGTGYFVTNSVTWADLAIFALLETMADLAEDAFNRHKALQEFEQRIVKDPKLSDWLKERPMTEI